MKPQDIAEHELSHIISGNLATPSAKHYLFMGEIEVLPPSGGKAVIFPSEKGLKVFANASPEVMKAVAVAPLALMSIQSIMDMISAKTIPDGSPMSDHDKQLWLRSGGNTNWQLDPADIDAICRTFCVIRREGFKEAAKAIAKAEVFTAPLADFISEETRNFALVNSNPTFKYFAGLGNCPNWLEEQINAQFDYEAATNPIMGIYE